MGLVQRRRHGSGPDLFECAGDAAVVEVGVVAEEEHEPLAFGQRGDRRPQVGGVDAAVAGLGDRGRLDGC